MKPKEYLSRRTELLLLILIVLFYVRTKMKHRFVQLTHTQTIKCIIKYDKRIFEYLK